MLKYKYNILLLEKNNMLNSIEAKKNSIPSKQTIGKYKTWELKLKTKKQVDTLIEYNNWTKWRNSDKIINLIPRLGYNEFITFIDKEIKKQNFTQKNIDYYEALIKRLNELKSNINDKITFRFYTDKIEEWILKINKSNNTNYYEYIIENNPQYKKIYDILNSKYLQTKLLAKDSNESYLAIYKNEKNKNNTTLNDNIDDLLSLLYEWKLDSSIHLMKVTNNKLKEIYGNDSDIEKYLKGKIRWREAIEKINEIYNNLDPDTAILLSIKNYIDWDEKRLSQVNAYLNQQNWKQENNIDPNLVRANKLEIKTIQEDKNNKLKIDDMIEQLISTDNKSIITGIVSNVKHIKETKKEKESFDYFIKKLVWNRYKKKDEKKNYSHISDLKKIKDNISKITKSKTRDFLIEEITNKLAELEK